MFLSTNPPRPIPGAVFNEKIMKCYDLTPEQLTDSPLARLAVDVGHPSLTSLLNANNWWSLTVDEVVDLLSDPVVI
jgi:hypothetical protein